MVTFGERLKQIRAQKGMTQEELAQRCGMVKQNISRYENSDREPTIKTAKKMAEALGVEIEELARGTYRYEQMMRRTSPQAPDVIDDEDVVTFEILGSVAAGYDHHAQISNDDYGDFSYGQLDVPKSWLRGRPRSDYFVLRVDGDSMYPMYQDGDLVLVLKQSTMNRSGQIGVVMYEDESATLKKIEYVMGEDWMKLIPVNPMYPPIMVVGEALEHCRVQGIPVMMVRRAEI